MGEIYGALEAGGTKMVCALGDENGRILEQTRIPTTTPEETMSAVLDFFRGRGIRALGIGCFGPVDVNRDSATWGRILDTPKLAWRDYDVAETAAQALGVPVGFDTDVNASLLGEVTYGDSKGLTDVVYYTIGTGIGAGILAGGQLLHGMLHPEAGHMLLTPAPGDTYPGKCPYHGHCFEGLASGPAIADRWGKSAEALKDKPEVWKMEAYYIARALTNTIMILSPQRIILGGGVMHQEQLFPMIRKRVRKNISGYLHTREMEDLDTYIVPASLHDDQGIMGAVRLAIDAASRGV